MKGGGGGEKGAKQPKKLFFNMIKKIVTIV